MTADELARADLMHYKKTLPSFLDCKCYIRVLKDSREGDSRVLKDSREGHSRVLKYNREGDSRVLKDSR